MSTFEPKAELARRIWGEFEALAKRVDLVASRAQVKDLTDELRREMRAFRDEFSMRLDRLEELVAEVRNALNR